MTTTLPDSETAENSYDGWARSLVDQNDHLKRWDSDGLGRMTKVSEYTGSDPSVALYAETTYEYNVRDEFTKVTDAADNITTISYDELGRKTSMTDPDMGSWSYSDDAVGNPVEQTDADRAAASTSAGSGKGRRTAMWDAAGRSSWSYDEYGRVTTQTRVDGRSYASDALNRVREMTDPDGEEPPPYPGGRNPERRAKNVALGLVPSLGSTSMFIFLMRPSHGHGDALPPSKHHIW